MVETLLEPGEGVLRAAAAESTMVRAGVIAIGYAVPALALAWFPLRKVAAHWPPRDGAMPAVLFAAFGLVWLLIGLRLLYEPMRLRRLYPHVLHLLTDRRFLAIDRRSGPLHQVALAEVRQMKTFPPFGRVTLWRRGLVSGTGRYAGKRDFDGVRDPEAVAALISQRTGVAVGLGD